MAADKDQVLFVEVLRTSLRDYDTATLSPEKQEAIHRMDAIIARLLSVENALDPFHKGKTVEQPVLVEAINSQNLQQLWQDVRNLQATINTVQSADPTAEATAESTGLTNAEKAGLLAMAKGAGYIIVGLAGLVAGAVTTPFTFGAGTALGVVGAVASFKQGVELIIAGRNKFAGIEPADPTKLSQAEWDVNDIENTLNSLEKGLESFSNSMNNTVESVVSFFFSKPQETAAVTTPAVAPQMIAAPAA